jgi:hypothetical protein
MKPSPAAILTVFLFAVLPAHAGDDLATAISKCAALNDNTARLVCYDKIAGRPTTIEVTPQTQVQAAPPAQTAASAPPAKNEGESWFGIADWFGSDKASPAVQTTPKQFGSENLPSPPVAPGTPTPSEPLDHITATLSDFAYNPYGRFVAFLDNGQIWQQLEADTGQARFSKSKKDQVTISRGLIGSYNLVIEGHNGLYKVKRIK